jgi:hypothetical protein
MARLLLAARTAASFAVALLAGGAALGTPVVGLDASSAEHGPPGRVEVSMATPAPVTLETPRMAPGDTAVLTLNVVVPSGGPVVALTTEAEPSSLLDQDPVDGLRLEIERCSGPWQAMPGGNRPRYGCPGRSFPVLAQQPVVLSNVALPNLDAGQAEQHLLLSLTLPESAGNDFQGLSSTIHYTFTASEQPLAAGAG